MILQNLKKFASIKGWKIEKNIAYGEENGYLFTVIAGQGAKIFICPLPSISENSKNQILNYLHNNKKILEINEFIFENNVLIIKFKEFFIITKIETMNNLLGELTNFLKTKDVKGKECCIFCGHDNAYETVYIDNIMYSAHSECYAHQVHMLEDAAREYESEDKNYFRGFIGALIGGLIISIPWSLAQVYLYDRLSAIFAAFVGVGLLKAYYIFKGKLGGGTRWIIAVCTFISVIISQLMVIEIEMLKHGTTLEYNDFIELFGITQLAGYFKSNLEASLFVAFIGFIFLFFQLKGDVKSVLPKVEKKQ